MVTARINSGLEDRPWLRRSIDWKGKREVIRDFLFVHDKGRRAFLKYFESEFLGRIDRVQSFYP